MVAKELLTGDQLVVRMQYDDDITVGRDDLKALLSTIVEVSQYY